MMGSSRPLDRTIWVAATWRRMRGRSATALADRAMHEYSRLSGTGGVRSALGMGLRLFLIIGFPLGALLAAFVPASPNERFFLFLGFLGMTALWTFPFGFVIRWMTLRSYRQWTRSV